MAYDFRGKKAIVTGGAKGIGLEIVRALYECKAERIYILDRLSDRFDDVKKQIPVVETISVDLSDWDVTQSVVSQIEPVDFLVNNAGLAYRTSWLDATEEQIDRLMNVNLKATVNVSKEVCKKMLERGGGAVVNISSVVSQAVFASTLAYSASKYAVDGVTKCMAKELSPKIRVNSVHPYVVMTDMTLSFTTEEERVGLIETNPMKRMPTTRDIANGVLFLLSDHAAMIQAQHLRIDGGFSAL